MILLWAILTLILSLGLFMIAYSGVAVAISFLSKLFFFFAFLSMIVSIVLFIIERHKLKAEHKKMLEENFIEKEKKIGKEIGKELGQEIRQEIQKEIGKDIGSDSEKEFEKEIEREIESELKK